MQDPRLRKLAKVLINHSTRLKEGEKVLIEAIDIPPQIVTSLIEEARAVGGLPFVTLKSNEVLRSLYTNATEQQMVGCGEIEKFRMEKMDAYIGIRGSNNISELSDVPQDQMKLYQKNWWQPVHIETRVRKTKWVVLRYPTSSMAQLSGQSTPAFEDFYFNVCTLDYERMSKAMDPLKELMDKTDKVHLKGPGTDLEFSIKGLGSVKCDGKLNIPDGEVFSAPVKDSINGQISFNTPTIYHGTTFENIKLQFKDGKVVEATASDTEKFNNIIDSDDGSRYVGEFALGCNPYITKAMKDILFDEKIRGSLHMALGNAYDETDNGNRSEIHWDLVLIQTPDYGGGEIHFDDVLIRKDGEFVLEELKGLNPDKLAE